MPGNFKKDDLRVEKTLNAIQEALFKLLERRSFGQITVNKLCEEAQISRRTFYLHFNAKYDLLKFCLTNINTKIGVISDDSNHYAQVKRTVYQLISENERIISNLVKDANDETSFMACGQQIPAGYGTDYYYSFDKPDHAYNDMGIQLKL